MTVERLIALLKEEDQQAIVKCMNDDGIWMPLEDIRNETGAIRLHPEEADDDDDDWDDDDEEEDED